MARPPETGTTRGEVVCTRLTDERVAKIDQARGAQSRSAFIRAAIDEKIERGRKA